MRQRFAPSMSPSPLRLATIAVTPILSVITSASSMNLGCVVMPTAEMAAEPKPPTIMVSMEAMSAISTDSSADGHASCSAVPYASQAVGSSPQIRFSLTIYRGSKNLFIIFIFKHPRTIVRFSYVYTLSQSHVSFNRSHSSLILSFGFLVNSYIGCFYLRFLHMLNTNNKYV